MESDKNKARAIEILVDYTIWATFDSKIEWAPETIQSIFSEISSGLCNVTTVFEPMTAHKSHTISKILHHIFLKLTRRVIVLLSLPNPITVIWV